MKKYVKPELFYERYELSQHIANCQWELNQTDAETCVAYPEDGLGYENKSLFTTAVNCDIKTDTGAYEDYCYQAGADGNMKVFAS